METMINLILTFDDNLNANIAVRKTTIIDGEKFPSPPWRCVLEKGMVLDGLVFDTSFGPVALADYPAEKQYIEAKWAEVV